MTLTFTSNSEPGNRLLRLVRLFPYTGLQTSMVGVAAAYTNGIFMPGGANRVAEAAMVNNRIARMADFLIRADT